jgi:RimJ/RimL family protein N-acetyltransferase
MEYARACIGLKRVVAIVSPDNARSIRLLEKLGMRFDRFMSMKGGPDDTSLYVHDFEAN